MGLNRGNAKTAFGRDVAGSGFMGLIRGDAKTAFGPRDGAGSRCKGLRRGAARSTLPSCASLEQGDGDDLLGTPARRDAVCVLGVICGSILLASLELLRR